MALSRRQFFRRFWNHNERTEQERRLRLSVLQSYARTHLLPYDFELTPAQYSELFEDVRIYLEQMTDEELFSPNVRNALEAFVENKVGPWREAFWMSPPTQDLPEL